MPRKFLALAGVTAVALVAAVPAYAFDCTVAKKPPTAGAIGIEGPGGFTALKPNPGTDEHPHGAFIAFTDGTNTASTYVHAPGGVLPPVRDGGPQHDCDGKGHDSLEVCFGA